MRRHPSAVTRDQRAMTQARTLGRRHHGADVADAREYDAATTDDQDRRRCRVVRCLSPQRIEVIARTSVTAGIALATAVQRRCVVVLENGKTVFDNRREF
jgi:hypothetical protein